MVQNAPSLMTIEAPPGPVYVALILATPGQLLEEAEKYHPLGTAAQ